MSDNNSDDDKVYAAALRSTITKPAADGEADPRESERPDFLQSFRLDPESPELLRPVLKLHDSHHDNDSSTHRGIGQDTLSESCLAEDMLHFPVQAVLFDRCGQASLFLQVPSRVPIAI